VFVVYSPEGQAIAASAQQLSTIKVDPATRINQVEDPTLKEVEVDEQSSSSSRNIKNKISAYQKNAADTHRRKVVRAAEVMSHPVITIEQDSTIAHAFERMQRLHIDYLPVVSDEVLVGLCTREALLRRVLLTKDGRIEVGGNSPISDVVTPQVVTTELFTDIRQVAYALSFYDLGALVVTNQDGEHAGIITRGDLIKRLAQEPPLELYV